MRPQYEGSLPESVRCINDELQSVINHLETLLEFEHSTLVIRQLIPAARELTQARASLGMAAVAAEMEQG